MKGGGKKKSCTSTELQRREKKKGSVVVERRRGRRGLPTPATALKRAPARRILSPWKKKRITYMQSRKKNTPAQSRKKKKLIGKKGEEKKGKKAVVRSAQMNPQKKVDIFTPVDLARGKGRIFSRIRPENKCWRKRKKYAALKKAFAKKEEVASSPLAIGKVPSASKQRNRSGKRELVVPSRGRKKGSLDSSASVRGGNFRQNPRDERGKARKKKTSSTLLCRKNSLQPAYMEEKKKKDQFFDTALARKPPGWEKKKKSSLRTGAKGKGFFGSNIRKRKKGRPSRVRAKM